MRANTSGAEDSVAALIREARGGSREALDGLLERYRDYLLFVARTELASDLLRSKGGASDLVQETFLEAQRDFQQFQGGDGAAVVRWLRGLLRNNARDFVRGHRRAERRRVGREHSLDAPEAEGWQAASPGEENSPSEQAVAREQEQRLRLAIARLPTDYQQVILLRHAQRGSWAEVAEKMDRSVGAVQKLWVRALEQLRQQLPRE